MLWRCKFHIYEVVEIDLQELKAVRQADVGVLVISARKGEIHDKGVQTREHALLATFGVSYLVVVINKMHEGWRLYYC